jgi:squalene-hopene/tetraprenyl-beta-curcumene cyclase
MSRTTCAALSLFATLVSAIGQQDPPATAPASASKAGKADKHHTRHTGTIYKDEIDMVIDALCRRAHAAGGGPLGAPLGGDSVLLTAQVLTAMGHCHRYYHRGDGPVVRPSLELLLKSRQADGAFGSGDDAARARATAWVADALACMDADGYADEIATARGWLAKHGAAESCWQQAVSAVLAAVRADAFPQQLAADEAALAKQAFAQPAGAEPAGASLDALAAAAVRLVACQEANRELDKTQSPPAGAFAPSQQRAFDWLLAQQHDDVFGVTKDKVFTADPSLTGFALLALQTKPKEARTQGEQAAIERGLRWLCAHQNADGSFGEQLLNYTTSVAVGALVRWDDPAVKPALAKAQRFLLACQFLESNGYQSSDRDYGAMGYGGNNSRRADLSNTNFALQALRDTGLPENNEAFQKAIVFLQRTQNLKSVNDFKGKAPDPENNGRKIEATSGDDGGACYYPGNSSAGYIVLPDGKSMPRSYGSMTYALLKAYSLCGLKADDARIQAAVKWIQANWTLAENPGIDPALGDKARFQGLFYYYMVLAQALDLVSVREVTATGKNGKPETVDWRKALRAHLEGLQAPNGTWVNGKNERWMEGRDFLCTCYALIALEHCR